MIAPPVPQVNCTGNQTLLLFSESVERRLPNRTYDEGIWLGVEETLTIAANALLLTPKFYDVLKEFYVLFPFTQLNLNVVENNLVADMVERKEADIGFMIWGQEPPRNVELGSIGYVSFAIAVHQSHPLLSDSNVVFDNVKDYHQVLLKDSPLHYNLPLTRSNSIVNNLEGLLR